MLITLLQYLAHVPSSYVICYSLLSQLVTWLDRWLVSAPCACFCHEEKHHMSYVISKQGQLPTSRSWIMQLIIQLMRPVSHGVFFELAHTLL